ncbi:transmembrane protein 106B-like [Liolophura sinensis]|uniref:transmembrane protein 106B-like n=1 Tax=Liolophura sinensis TaxID=3198878 RepID=UPI0031594ECE
MEGSNSALESESLKHQRTRNDYGSTSAVLQGSVNGRANFATQGSPDLVSNSSGYEEFFRGSVPCPSCRGLGRIRKEDERGLVAIIPMKDERLKPRRTYLYVLIAVIVSILVAGLILFFMFPRSVVALSKQPYLEPNYLHINVTMGIVNFTVTNRYNFSNSNYFPVTITGIQSSVMYDMKVLTTGKNNTQLRIPMRSTKEQTVNLDILLQGDEAYLATYCADHRKWVHDLFMQFELTANYSYLGRTEQTTLTTYQHVSCGNSTSV